MLNQQPAQPHDSELSMFGTSSSQISVVTRPAEVNQVPSDSELSMFGAPTPAPTAPRVLRVGGVPEHFNYPWQVGINEGFFDKYNCKVEWVVMKCGTGQMIQALKSGEVDMIVALTEGLVKDIAQGSDLRLLATYVQSPLCWAVSAGAESDVSDLSDLQGTTFGISRYTSGSHLMAYTLAMQEGWDPQNDVKFSVEGNFQNLRDSVNLGRTEAFMWETFTTKPYHDSGEVRRVGEVYTPWPAFMLAARETTLERDPELVRDVLAGIGDATSYFHRARYLMPRSVATACDLDEKDVQKWYEGVNITASSVIERSAIEKATSVLIKVGVLAPGDYPPENFLGLDAVLDEADRPAPLQDYSRPQGERVAELKASSPSASEAKECEWEWPLTEMFAHYRGFEVEEVGNQWPASEHGFAHYS